MKPSNNNMRYSQNGMTVFGAFLLLVIVAAVALAVIRIVPAYIENYNVKRVLIDLVEDAASHKMDPHQIRQTVVDRLKFSGIHDVKDKKIIVKRVGNATRVDIDYVVRKPLVGNIDVLITFHDDVEILRR